MGTVKQRVNITLDDEIYTALKNLSLKTKKSISGLGLELIEKALEMNEDIYFSRKADERLKKKEKKISHEKAWE
ncbi:MAG: ribbon-helix-helix domain-containing protein [Bacteriovoracaceae bacterium]|nr:ribbon-helix-helix domain-containing protein [Bacteriovoracaceae bacterium]